MAERTAADTIATIIPYLQPLVDTIEGLARTPTDVKEKVKTAMDGVQSGVRALADSETASQSRPILERIEADAQAVLVAAAGFPLPFPFGVILMVASTLLPSVFSAVNLLMQHHVDVPATAPPTPAA